MVRKRVTIIHKSKALRKLAEVIGKDSLCYYLAEDYSIFMELQNKFKGIVKIKNLEGLFDTTFQEMKEALLELLSDLNKKYNSFAWWGGHLASKSTPATPLLLNTTYLLCAKKILLENPASIILIVESPALSQCLSEFARRQGYQVSNCCNRISEWTKNFIQGLRYVAQIGRFSLVSLHNFWAAFRAPRYQLPKESSVKKRVVIRSWVTQSILNGKGKFADRNFGNLPQWLSSRGYEVWILPMFFNLSAMAMRKAYERIKDIDQTFLIPEHYLKFSDYLRSLLNGFKAFRQRIEGIQIEDIDISPIFNEVQRKQGFNVGLCLLNLSCQMLKRLKEAKVQIDGFYYAFECNAPENQFVLSCRQYFPEADIIGFQHTTFFSNQLAYHLAPGEYAHRPLPDKIICSGPAYRALHQKARFPETILIDGPNLRFESVYTNRNRRQGLENGTNKKKLLLPLTFSYNLAFELFVKVKEALKNTDNYRVYIRTHPLLSKKILKQFLYKINVDDWEFADEGIVQQWLPEIYAVVSTGGTVIILEAISFGTPVIRVIPDNTFYYDPFSGSNYPLSPVTTPLEIRQQLEFVDDIQKNEERIFEKISNETLHDYFPQPTEENLKVFL